jgi:hypothetical protein
MPESDAQNHLAMIEAGTMAEVEIDAETDLVK